MAETNFAIELDEKKGRVLVAKRSLHQGELILHEKPLGKLLTYTFILSLYFGLPTLFIKMVLKSLFMIVGF